MKQIKLEEKEKKHCITRLTHTKQKLMKGNIVTICVKLNRKTQHEGISMSYLYILSAVVHTTRFFFGK